MGIQTMRPGMGADVMSRQDMEVTLRRRGEALTRAEQELEQARRQASGATAPWRFSSPRDLEAERTRMIATVHEAEDVVLRQANTAETEARRISGTIRDLDVVRVPAGHEARAADLVPLVRGESAGLALGEVERRVRAALVADDPAALYAWTVVVRERLRATPAEMEQARPVLALVSQAEARLRDRGLASLRESAVQLLDRAGRIAHRIDQARRSRDGRPAFGETRTTVPFPGREPGAGVDWLGYPEA